MWDAPSSRDCPNPAPGSTTGVTSAALGREALRAFFACRLSAASTLRLTMVANFLDAVFATFCGFGLTILCCSGLGLLMPMLSAKEVACHA